MAHDYIITLSSIPIKLSVDTGRICIKTMGQTTYFAPEDIAILILDSPGIALTHDVIRKISENNGVILSTTNQHMPDTITLPISKNNQGARKAFLQLKHVNGKLYKECWRQVIQSKLYGQHEILKLYNLPNAGELKEYAKNLKVDQAYELEAFGAKLYWKSIFNFIGDTDKRYKQNASDLSNICFNFGYSIIRSIIARNIVYSGLISNFGIGHIRKDNPFNLVEDFVEPFRYLVDKTVLHALYTGEIEEFDTTARQYIINTITKEPIFLNNVKYKLFVGIDKTISSFSNILEIGKGKIELPNTPLKGRPSKTFSIKEHKKF